MKPFRLYAVGEMGQICSAMAGAKEPDRDPDDKFIDEIKMKKTKIAEFDEVFDKAADPLNSLMTLNNCTVDSVEQLKEATALAQGQCKIELSEKNTALSIRFTKIDEKGNVTVVPEKEMNAKYDESVELAVAKDSAMHLLSSLNHSLSDDFSDSEWRIFKGRLRITKSGDQDSRIRAFNRSLFTFRKHLAAQVHMPGIKGAMNILKKDLDQDCMPSVSFDDNGAPKISFGDDSKLGNVEKKLSPQTRLVFNAMKEFQDSCTEAAEQLPAITEHMDSLSSEAAEFPAKVQDVCMDAGLSPTEIMGAAKKINTNMKLLASGPQISKSVMKTIKETAAELRDACAIPVGA